MRRATGTSELMDGPLEDRRELEGNLRDLSRINRWLGGAALSRRAVAGLVAGKSALTLLDVGTGGGDIPVALLAWARRTGIDLRVDAVDARPEMIEIARSRTAGTFGLSLAIADGRRLPHADGSVDICHVSLVLHHLEPAEALELLRELARVARVGVIVNDLERSRLGLLGAWLIGHLLTWNRLTRSDAPLSVRRAYRADEVVELAAQAGLRDRGRWWDPFRTRYALAFTP